MLGSDSRAAWVSDLETSRRVVLRERAAIARDLHDSVAHHVSLMVVQAETGPDIVVPVGR